MPEEVLVGHCLVVELVVVGPRVVEVLAVSGVNVIVVFGHLHVEVGYPSELSVDVSLLAYFGVIRHASALDLVLFIRVQLSERGNERFVNEPVFFVKVRLEMVNTNSRLTL